MKNPLRLRWVTMLVLGAGCCLFFLFASLLSSSIGSIKPVNVPLKYTRPAPLIWRIVQTRQTKSSLIISGWAAYPGQVSKIYNIHLLLRDRKSGLYYQLPTAMVIGRQGGRNAADTFNGFRSSVQLRQLKQPLSDYELFIQYYSDNKRIVADTHLVPTERRGSGG